jgi:hypothetical protein
MKYSTMNAWRFSTLLATVGLSAFGFAKAQEPISQGDLFDEANDTYGTIHQQARNPAEQPPLQNSPYVRSWSSSRTFPPGVRPGPNPGSAIRKAAEAVRDAKGDEAKSAAQKKFTELLSKCYDDDVAQREKELKQIEDRLAKLRELLDRRRTKKQEIIELQMKVAQNEAEGLGFYDGDRPAKGGATSFSLPTPLFNPPTPSVNNPHSNSPAASPAATDARPKGR